MFSTGFSMDTERIAEPFDGPSAQFLVDQATDARPVGVRFGARGAAGRRPARRTRSCSPRPTARCTATARSTRSRYGGEHEKYAAGDRARHRRRSRASAARLFVCYDLRFADEFWALAPDTDCYVVVANWPAPRRDHWRTLLRARAIENQAYVVGVNRVGQRRQARLRGRQRGRSVPFGEDAGGGRRARARRPCSPTSTAADVAETRAKYPFLTDRR